MMRTATIATLMTLCCVSSQAEQGPTPHGGTYSLSTLPGGTTTADSTATAFTPAKLCNPLADAPTQQLYQLLCRLYGSRILSGTVANVDWNTREADNVKQWTGRYPALNVFDFINFHHSKDVDRSAWVDYTDISPVMGWWLQGGLVGCMWHWQVLGNNGKDYTCTPGSAPEETSIDLGEIDNPASTTYKKLVGDIDQVARYLARLQQVGIPVIWRPLHEAAGNTYEYQGGKAWFWWGAKGAGPFKKLWRLMYDRFTHVHHLNNLIWVWTAQGGDESWYPGDDVVDIVGCDRYGLQAPQAATMFKSLTTAYPHKLVTLAECGNYGDKALDNLGKIWDSGARFSWFMTWYDYDYNNGKRADHRYAGPDWWREAIGHEGVMTRNELKGLAAPTVTEKTLWRGPSVIMRDDWSVSAAIRKDFLKDVRVGDVLHFQVSRVAKGAAMKVMGFTWQPLSSEVDGTQVGTDGVFLFVDSEALLAAMQLAGDDGVAMRVGGKGYRLDRISVVRRVDAADKQ